MKSLRIPPKLALCCAALSLLPVTAVQAEPPTSTSGISADTVLKQMSEKLGAAQRLSFRARRGIVPDLAGGDGLHGNTKISITVERPDKMMATATLPGDTRLFYFDGKHLTLVDEEKEVYSTVPMAVSLDQLPSELARIYGFTPPLAEFLVSDLYKDLTWRAQAVEYRGEETLYAGLFGPKRVHCYRVGLTGKHADSELWISSGDLLPRRWVSKFEGPAGEVKITFEFSKWNLQAKTDKQGFVFSPDEDDLEVPMITEAEMTIAREAMNHDTGGKQ